MRRVPRTFDGFGSHLYRDNCNAGKPQVPSKAKKSFEVYVCLERHAHAECWMIPKRLTIIQMNDRYVKLNFHMAKNSLNLLRPRVPVSVADRRVQKAGSRY
jgi:hypothetical protein